MLSVTLMLLLVVGSCVYGIDLIQSDSVVVQPGQSVTITCQVSGYSLTDRSYATGWIRQREGKTMEWILHRWGSGDLPQNNALKNKFLHHTYTSSSSVTLTGVNLQPEDTAVYYCVRTTLYGAFDYWGKGTTVTVSSATSSPPTVFPLVPCGSESGDMVTLGCLATGFTPPEVTFSWNKGGTALTDFIQYRPVQKGNAYTGVSQIQVSKQDWDKQQNFQCVVNHAAGTGQAIVDHTPEPVQDPTLKVFSSSSDEDGTYTASCFAKEFSPKNRNIKWLKNRNDITSKIDLIEIVSESKNADGKKVYNAASFLTVNASDVNDRTTFMCVFMGGQHPLNKTVPNKEIQPGNTGCVTAEIVRPKSKDMLYNKKGTIKCVVQTQNGAPKISWEDENGGDIASNPVIKSKDGYESNLDITYDEWTRGVKRVCVVHHTDLIVPLREDYERDFGGSPQRPSVFMLPPLEQTSKAEVTLTCFVKDFFPKDVYVSWLVDDEEADSSYAFNTTEPIENNGFYSAYGQLFVSLDQWQRDDAVYSCLVYHESVVNTTRAIVRSVGYRTFDKNRIDLNMNINQEKCMA